MALHNLHNLVVHNSVEFILSWIFLYIFILVLLHLSFSSIYGALNLPVSVMVQMSFKFGMHSVCLSS
jgi:hypothetical protein